MEFYIFQNRLLIPVSKCTSTEIVVVDDRVFNFSLHAYEILDYSTSKGTAAKSNHQPSCNIHRNDNKGKTLTINTARRDMVFCTQFKVLNSTYSSDKGKQQNLKVFSNVVLTSQKWEKRKLIGGGEIAVSWEFSVKRIPRMPESGEICKEEKRMAGQELDRNGTVKQLPLIQK